VSTAGTIIEAALAAHTLDDARKVDELIAAAVGQRFERPVGDKVNNFGLMTTSGSYDFKLIENVTNMQDALLERAAADRYRKLELVPYPTPHEAAADLFPRLTEAELGRQATVGFFEADQPARKSKRLTAVFRDLGCGIDPSYVADSIFALGSEHKTKTIWQQGAFGIGGATTFRNADAIVLVSRRAPEMNPADDVILVAVCLWQRSLKGKGLFYLVTQDWKGDKRAAVPWSAPAREFPEFESGTHLALINYGTERLHAIRHSDNPNSFERVLDTRLFRPVTPVRMENHLVDDHPRTRRGLARRFEENPRTDRKESAAALPFRIGGSTYQLPVTFYFFTPPRLLGEGKSDTIGQKKNFVADGHTVLFTSNGQVHHHWTPVAFRERTKLRQLSEHVLVVVETDPLPIAVRTDFFTADRSGVRSSEEALRLESELAGFLDGWDELRELNAELIRESIMSASSERPTFDISKQISRAFAARLQGFKFQSNGRNGDTSFTGRDRQPKPPPLLYPDPTFIKGPSEAVVLPGKSKAIRFTLDAKDAFFSSGRGSLTVNCSHPDINEEEVAIGPLHAGCVRVIVAVPAEAQLGEFTVTAGVYAWEKASGGLGPDLEWTTKLTVVDELLPPTPPEPSAKDKNRTIEGPQVALLWRHGDQIELLPKNPGKVEQMPAAQLARDEQYKELAALGQTPVLTIFLNEDYSPLKKYLQGRRRELTKIGSGHAYNRYAIDVGVALLVIHHAEEQRRKHREHLDEALLEVARDAAAQGAISILPHFDALAREAGIDL
jgi:hypothetical protein